MHVIFDNLGYFLVGPYPNGPIGGLVLTLYLAVAIGAAAFAFGVCVASLSLAPARVIRWLGIGLTIFIRGMPSIAFLFWMFFLVPRLLDTDLSAFQSVAIAFALYHGAYMAEDIRGGIQAVARGQLEVGRATGLNPLQILRHIVLPQAVRAVIPALINRFVNLLMYTSIASMLGVLEFTRAAVLVNNRELVYPMEIFGFIGLVYFVICYGLTRLGRHLERRWDWAPKVNTLSMAA